MKPITVTITKEKHKSQPWTYAIDLPGPSKNDKGPGRFTERSNARRAARRKLGAFWNGVDAWLCMVKGQRRVIQFVFVDNTTKR